MTEAKKIDRHVRVIAKRDGFRRAGMAHSGDVTHPAGTFTRAQIDAMKADPNLIVHLDGDGPAPAALDADAAALPKQVEDLTAENAALKKRVADLEEQRADKTGSSPDAGGGGGNAKAAGAPSGRKGGGK